MKHAMSISLSLLICMIPPIYSTNFLSKVKDSISKGLNKIKYGDDYNNPFIQFDKMRVVLFENLKEKYKYSDATELSKEDILELKKQLIDKNTRSVIRNEDIPGCLMRYDDIYRTMKNEENNIYFVDTILPVLLEGYTFHRTKEIDSFMTNDSIFIHARDNAHLMRSLIFHYQIPLNLVGHSQSWTLMQLDRIRNLKKLYENEEGYLKTILTPPDSWMQKTKKEIISSLCFFIISLQKLKKENPQSCAYNLPKAVIFNCILRELIKGSVEQEALVTKNIIEDLSTDLKIIKKIEKRTNKTHAITSFLENDFEQWAHKTINPEVILYNAIVKNKNVEKVN